MIILDAFLYTLYVIGSMFHLILSKNGWGGRKRSAYAEGQTHEDIALHHINFSVYWCCNPQDYDIFALLNNQIH